MSFNGSSYLDFMNSSEEFDALSSLQEFMMGLSSENLEESIQIIIQSDWIVAPKEIKQFAHTCVLVANYRPIQIENVAILIFKLLKHKNNENSLSLLPNFLISTIFRGLLYSKPFPKESSNLCFLYYCYRNNVFQILDIIHQIKLFSKELTERKRSLCWIFCYFAPEIQKADMLLFRQLRKTLKYCVQKKHFPPVFVKFNERYKELKKNNWTNFKTRRNQLYHKNTLIARLRNDDVNYFKKLSSSPNFNVDTKIVPNLYALNPLLQNHPTLIQVAALFGAVECFKFLMLSGADLSVFDKHYIRLPDYAIAGGNIEIIRLCQLNGLDFEYSLHTAAKYHRLDIIEWLLQEICSDLTILDTTGMTALHLATESSFLSGMKLFLDRDVDINSRSFRGWTPIRMAVRHGHLDAFRFLMAHRNLDVNVQTRSGVAPIHFAAKYGDLEICRILLEKGNVNVNFPTEKNWRPIHYAVTNGQYEITKYLLTFNNILLNEKCGDGDSPLHFAIIAETTSIAKLLINDPRVDVNLRNNKDFPPLMLALKHNRYNIFKELLKRPDIDVQCSVNGSHSIFILATKYSDPKFVQALIDSNKVDVNEVASEKFTPLHLAISTNRIEIVKLLCNNPNTDMNQQSKGHRSPLHMAVAHNCVEMIYLLLMNPKTDVNAKAKDDLTPLHVACLNGYTAAVSALLIRDDIDVNAKDKLGITPLLFAANKGYKDIIDILLSKQEINPNIKANNGAYPLGIARKKGYIDIIKMLQPFEGRQI